MLGTINKGYAKAVDLKYYSLIRESTKLDTNSYLVLYFHTDGSCSGCITEILSQLDCINKSELSNVEIACFVTGSREIETSAFRKNFSYLGSVFLNSDNIAKKLGLKYNSTLAIINFYGEILLDLNQKEATVYRLCNKITNIVPEY